MSRFMLGSRTAPGGRNWRRWLMVAGALALLALLGALLGGYTLYHDSLRPLDRDTTTYDIVIPTGSTPSQIGHQLKTANLIRSASGFEWYVRLHRLAPAFQAGTYAFSSSQSVQQIVAQIAAGKIVRNVVIILPEQRLDQIKDAFYNAKFSRQAVDNAFDPAQYSDIPVLADKPAGADLEGYLYPDTFQKDAQTPPSAIIRQSLLEMNAQVTPELKAAYAQKQLSVYQGVTLASIVEQEVSKPEDRAQVAQVFLRRLQLGMPLGSDVTAYYGSRLAGHPGSLTFDSPYNTLIHQGLPPGPISNVSAVSLQAVAHPAATDWLYFVTGDDGTTHFSKTLAEHQALTRQYCHALCGQ